MMNPISLLSLFFPLLITPVLPGGETPSPEHDSPEPYFTYTIAAVEIETNASISKAAVLFHEMELEKSGLSEAAFAYAYQGYLKLLERKKISKPEYLVICDFSQSSRTKRMYIIDMVNEELTMQTYVAHGRNSGLEYASRFSNKPKSYQSSLGFYVTGHTYQGQHGLALNLYGLEPGFNDMAARRKVVLHGSEYVGENYLKRSKYMGRSFGCPAIPKKESKALIHLIKNGTCLFIYHPDKKYIKGSRILND